MRFLKLALLFIVIMLTQFSIFPRFSMSYFEPDLLFIAVILLALHKGPVTACAAGFLAGLLKDVNAGVILGSNAFVWIQVAMLNAMIRNYLVVDSPLVQVVMVTTSSLIAGILHVILLQLTVMQEPAGHYFLLIGSRILATAFMTWPISSIMIRTDLITERHNA